MSILVKGKAYCMVCGDRLSIRKYEGPMDEASFQERLVAFRERHEKAHASEGVEGK